MYQIFNILETRDNKNIKNWKYNNYKIKLINTDMKCDKSFEQNDW
jgi:hypothetical protein